MMMEAIEMEEGPFTDPSYISLGILLILEKRAFFMESKAYGIVTY